MMSSGRGLETAFYTFIVLLMFALVIDDKWRSHWWVGALLIVLSRSEGLILSYPLMMAVALIYRQAIPLFLKNSLFFGIGIFILLAVSIIFTIYYPTHFILSSLLLTLDISDLFILSY